MAIGPNETTRRGSAAPRRPSAATAARLQRFYSAARAHFGYTSVWWPGTPSELTATAILVQQCNWSVAWQAAIQLRDAGLLNLARLAQADAAGVQDLIRPVTFAAQKSARLVRIAAQLRDQGCRTIEDLLRQGPTDRVRQQLLALPGIGPETADSVLLFASDRHETFVVDEYARRLFERLQLFPERDVGFWRRPYEDLRLFFLGQITAFMPAYDHLPLPSAAPRTVALLRDFHAQIVELGRHHCRKTNPRCAQRGWPGWTDKAGHFVFCESHCANNGCECCPLLVSCAAARSQQDSRQRDNGPPGVARIGLAEEQLAAASPAAASPVVDQADLRRNLKED
jgi:endonuclease-3 related protein